MQQIFVLEVQHRNMLYKKLKRNLCVDLMVEKIKNWSLPWNWNRVFCISMEEQKKIRNLICEIFSIVSLLNQLNVQILEVIFFKTFLLWSFLKTVVFEIWCFQKQKSWEREFADVLSLWNIPKSNVLSPETMSFEYTTKFEVEYFVTLIFRNSKFYREV